MTPHQLSQEPIVKVGMLIRKPISEVFEAFVDPEVSTNFWFTKSSGRLDTSKEVTWEWEMYGASAQVRVKEIDRNKRIVIEWGQSGKTDVVEWEFTPFGKEATYVQITNSAFPEEGDKMVERALDAASGFTTVLDGAKAWLEYGIRLNLVADKYPAQSAED